MESINFDNLTDNQKDTIFKIGLLKIGEVMYDGLVPVEKIKKNMNLLKDTTGLKDEDIWKCYEFTSLAVIVLGKPKARETIGFKNSSH